MWAFAHSPPTMNPDAVLERKLSHRARIIVCMIVCLLPSLYVLKQFDAQTKFTRLIDFGPRYLPRALPEIRALHPAESPARDGYDGQFYAQIAVRPLLNGPDLKRALDNPSYRAHKILLPAIAYLLGLGNPAWVVNIYAVLNLVFWFMLFFGMVHYLHAETWRDFLCIVVTVLTTGVMLSLERALTDLPALTIGFYAAVWTGALSSCAIGLGLLTRDTAVVFLLRDAWPLPENRAAFLKLALRTALLAVLPLVLWRLYVWHIFGGVSVKNMDVLGMPFAGVWEYLETSWRDFHSTPFKLTPVHPDGLWEMRLSAVLGGFSMIVQAVSLVAWRRVECPFWRIGIGMVFLMVFFTAHVYEEYVAMCRVCLSVTLAYNIGLMRQKGRVFFLYFAAGNAGMLWGLHDMVAGVLRF